MKISEKELEDYIFKKYNSIDGLSGDYIIRQFSLKGYGILDLLIIDYEFGCPTYKIVELKEGELDEKSISQISRYIRGLERNIDKIKKQIPIENDKNNEFSWTFPRVEGILIGKEFLGDSCYIADQAEKISTIFYSISLESGLSFDFNTSGWFNKNEKTNQTLEKITKKAYINYKKYGQTD